MAAPQYKYVDLKEGMTPNEIMAEVKKYPKHQVVFMPFSKNRIGMALDRLEPKKKAETAATVPTRKLKITKLSC